MRKPEGLGLAVAIFGAAVLLGFGAHIRWLVQLQTGRDASMSVAGAISLVLGGVALVWTNRALNGWRRPVLWGPRVLTLVLLALNAIGFAENLFDVNLGIDWPSLHYWLADPALRVGRPSLTTSLGFLLVGAALLVLPNLRSRRRGVAMRWLIGLTILVGASGVVGYVIHVEALITYHGIPAMPPYTAVALLTLAAGLWLAAKEQSWGRAMARAAQGAHILSTAALVLIVVVLVSGASGLAILWQVEQQNASANLSLRRDEHVAQITSLLSAAEARGRLWAQQQASPSGHAPHPTLTLPARDFNAAWRINARGEVTASAGTAVVPTLALPIAAGLELIWQDGYYLLQKLPSDGETLAIEQPIPLLSFTNGGGTAWGASGEIAMCGPDPADASAIACFPRPLRPYPVIVSRFIYQDVNRPISLALGGETGVTVAPDFRNQRALFAYAPVPGYRLGLIAKIDTSELYASIRLQLQLMIPLLAALTLLGLVTLRRQVRPMVRELVASRNEAIYSEARFRAAAESSMDAFYIFECVREPEHGTIVDFQLSYANSHGEAFAGLKPGTLGQPLSAFPRLVQAGSFVEKYKRVVETRQPLEEEFSNEPPGRAGPPVWLHQQVVALGDGVAVTVHDVTERKHHEERLTRLAQHDSLTGLPNRRAFLSRLEHAMETSQRLHQQSLLAVLFLDLDHLKDINDRYGHQQGDLLLRHFGVRLRESVRTSDMVARMGGDEFTVLLENLQGPLDAERVIAAIFAALVPGAQLDHTHVPMSTSIGVAFYHGQNISPEELLGQADSALYRAKREGRNRFRVFAAPLAI